jgi:hypothetical protein
MHYPSLCPAQWLVSYDLLLRERRRVVAFTGALFFTLDSAAAAAVTGLYGAGLAAAAARWVAFRSGDLGERYPRERHRQRQHQRRNQQRNALAHLGSFLSILLMYTALLVPIALVLLVLLLWPHLPSLLALPFPKQKPAPKDHNDPK